MSPGADGATRSKGTVLLSTDSLPVVSKAVTNATPRCPCGMGKDAVTPAAGVGEGAVTVPSIVPFAFEHGAAGQVYTRYPARSVRVVPSSLVVGAFHTKLRCAASARLATEMIPTRRRTLAACTVRPPKDGLDMNGGSCKTCGQRQHKHSPTRQYHHTALYHCAGDSTSSSNHEVTCSHDPVPRLHLGTFRNTVFGARCQRKVAHAHSPPPLAAGGYR